MESDLSVNCSKEKPIIFGSSPNTVGRQVKLRSTAMEENGGLEMVLQGSSLVVPPQCPKIGLGRRALWSTVVGSQA